MKTLRLKASALAVASLVSFGAAFTPHKHNQVTAQANKPSWKKL